MRQRLGITFDVPEGQEATGVYDDPGGIEVFETDDPYLLIDGASLESPLPVKIVDGPVFLDSMGNAQAAFGVSGLGPGPDPDPTSHGVVHEAIPVVHNGIRVVHNG